MSDFDRAVENSPPSWRSSSSTNPPVLTPSKNQSKSSVRKRRASPSSSFSDLDPSSLGSSSNGSSSRVNGLAKNNEFTINGRVSSLPLSARRVAKADSPVENDGSTINGRVSSEQRRTSLTAKHANISTTNKFEALQVAPWLVRSLSALAITRPTSIQRACIPEILKGRDCIGGSKTGSGKTIAFAVPILQKWAEDPVGIFAVVLTPTRELALQMLEQFNAIAAPQSLKAILITGGADMRTQALALAQRPHVVIATPGRLADHIDTSGEDTIAGLRRAKFVVFDEADRLLAGGKGSMLPDVETCLSALPPSSERQTCLFTATMTGEVKALAEMPRAAGRPAVFTCEVDTEVLAVPSTLRQMYLQVPVTQKEPFLHVLLGTPANVSRSVIVFCNHKATANLLEHMLRMLEHRVTALHSSLSQQQRIANLGRFRARAARILVATDVASRGLDIPEVELVINYDVPRNPDDYIHRVGRTARAGKRGDSITMVGQRDVDLVVAIEERVGGGCRMSEYVEDKVSVEARVVRDALKLVGEKRREAMLQIEEGREVSGKRRRRK